MVLFNSQGQVQRKQPVTRTPSLFTATRPREQAALCFSLGFTNELPTPGRGSRWTKQCTKGLGGTQSTIGDLAVSVRNDNASVLRPRNPNQTPSRFRCNSVACAATLCFEEGFSDSLPDSVQLQRNSRCTRGLGGIGGRHFGNLAPKSRFWGL